MQGGQSAAGGWGVPVPGWVDRGPQARVLSQVPRGRALRLCARLLLPASLALLSACGGTAGSNATPTRDVQVTNLAELGEKIFKDPSLSASGKTSCASCHDEAHAFAQPNTDPVPLGGSDLSQQGVRNAPSLKYLAYTPDFYFQADGTPTGGFDRDGRAKDFADQATRPFLTSFEMANASVADVIQKLSQASYASEFKALFGDTVFNDPEQAFFNVRQALQAYELESPGFAPFTSKYDYFLAGRATLSDAELRGLALFNNPQKGNCAACHPSARGSNGEPPMFTDFTYDNLGVPRNAEISANQDPSYYDLGLCGPFRTDLADRKDLCGAFKVPTLRNIALTAPYFHNGRFQSLHDVVSFYVRRDTNPEEWYPIGSDGVVQKFNDLPAEYVRNVNTTEVPYNRHPGELPALSDPEIEDVVAFLQTLTDGYQP